MVIYSQETSNASSDSSIDCKQFKTFGYNNTKELDINIKYILKINLNITLI